MQLSIVPVTPFQQNCSIVWCESSRRGAIVDPGGDLERITQVVADNAVRIERILLTHAHIDHAGAAAELSERLAIPIEGPHIDDKFWVDALPEQGQRFGFTGAKDFTPARWLEQGDEVRFGDERMQVLHCPGHTPGHVVFFHAGARLAIVGDVLIRGSVGRTDLPRGDYATLVQSITQRLWPLGAEVAFVPGHGPTSTFGDEREANPFVGDDVLN